MKKIYAILLAMTVLLFASKSFAAGGPDAYGYTWITSLDAGGPAFNWVDITTKAGVQTATGLADDNSAAGMINVGFNFHYYWNDYSQLKIGSNGWMSFDNVSNVASCFPTIPTAGSGENLLAPFMSDLNFTGAGNLGQVKYWTNNIDSCVISYINVPFWSVNAPGWSGGNTFQVILCAADSSITYQYGTIGSGLVNNAACVDMTVGIENSNGTIGLQVHSDVIVPSNYVIRFDYPSVVLLSIQDVLPNWNTNTENKAVFIPSSAPYTLVSDYKNAGNTAITTTINLQASILNLAPMTVHSSSGILPSLAAGADSIYAFPADWTPSATGQYIFRSTTTNSQDINTGNNTNDTELEVVNVCNPSMTLSYVTGNTPDGSQNWNGGANDDGMAVYYAPPVYPYDITTLQYYISSNVGNGFIAQVYDDDGANGGPGTLLFTQTISSASIISAAWNTVSLGTPVTLNDGGFYVVWLQGGTTIFLGTETAGPHSRRNYEILDGGWSEFRDNATKDALIRVSINGFSGLPVALFSETSDHLDAAFTSSSTGPGQSWSWDFGDGNSSTEENPEHTYLAPGTYTVCLTTTTPCGSDDSCLTVTICDNAIAAYTSADNDLTVDFTDQSTGTTDSWMWDFGDGNTSTQQHPSHTYTTSGTYNVCLIAENSCGYNDTICQTVTVCGTPTASYSSTPDQLSVDFTDQSSGNPFTWVWDFGDGNTSTQQNTQHVYGAPGTYTACLIASNSCGNSDTICQSVTVCLIPVAAYSTLSNGLSIDFTDGSGANADTWAWDFGDGNTSTQQNPTHLYASIGTYTVCLIASNSCGYSDTICQTVTVCGTLIADFSVTAVDLTLQTTEQSSGNPDSYFWDFGDGNTSTQQNPTHVYAAEGTYTVCLVVTNSCGESDTTCEQVIIDVNGIAETGQLVLNAYPNPTADVLHIAFSTELQHATIEVTDLTGKIVWSNKGISGSTTQVNVAEWSAGFYKIRVTHAGGTGVLTFVKQ
ncbi:MAG: PKD domain-containing protein [Bacteroidota bacterium]